MIEVMVAAYTLIEAEAAYHTKSDPAGRCRQKISDVFRSFAICRKTEQETRCGSKLSLTQQFSHWQPR